MISKKYNEMLKKLEYNISNKKELDFAKKAMCEISLAYVDEIAEITDNYSSKIIGLEKRVSDLENNLKDYNDEMVNSEKISLSETITCPYCGYDFLAEYDETNKETICPKCDNLIALDWGNFEDDM